MTDQASASISDFKIRPARLTRTALRAGLIGPSGSGKTYSALRLATGIAEVTGGDVIMLDTENHRGLQYADRFAFKHVDMRPPFSSERYREAIATIGSARPSVLIIDSLSHEHEGDGGLLDAHDQELRIMAGDNLALAMRLQAMAWRRPKAERRALLSQILRADMHIIICLRAGERTKPARDANHPPQEMGLTPVTGPEFLYELTWSALLYPGSGGRPTWESDLPGEAAAIKRPEPLREILCGAQALSEETGRELAMWADRPGDRAQRVNASARPARQSRAASRSGRKPARTHEAPRPGRAKARAGLSTTAGKRTRRGTTADTADASARHPTTGISADAGEATNV